MKKIFDKSLAIVTSIMLISTSAINASEYIVSNCTEDHKDEIYEIVSKYRVPSILSPFTQQEFQKKYPNLDLIETFQTKESEHCFIQNAIYNITKDKNTIVYSIPKSLYQFIVYDYFAETIHEPEKCTLETLFTEIRDAQEKFDLRKYAPKDSDNSNKENKEWELTKSCIRFMEHKDIKDIFWKVNEHARNLYKQNLKIEIIISKLLNKYSYKRLLDYWNTNQHKASRVLSRIEILVGKDFCGIIPTGWSEEKRQNLNDYISNIIISETKNPSYILYHASSNFDAPNPEIAYRKTICFSDGLGSGFLFDAGASAFVLSGGKNKLYKLELGRAELLRSKYPIFIPPAHHLLSGAGNGELFHVRTKVVQAVISSKNNSIDGDDNLLIQGVTDPIVPGYLLKQTPEYYTTHNPQILQKGGDYGNYTYKKTDEGEFDKDGAEKLERMIKNIKEIPQDG